MSLASAFAASAKQNVMSVYAVLIVFLVSDVVVKIGAISYASLSSDDGNFKLQ